MCVTEKQRPQNMEETKLKITLWHRSSSAKAFDNRVKGPRYESPTEPTKRNLLSMHTDLQAHVIPSYGY